MADYLTRAQLINSIERALKASKGSKEDLAENVLDMVYNEILSCDPLFPLFWLVKFDDSVASKAPTTITAITQANPGVISSVNSFANGDIVSLYDIGGMTELNGRTGVVANATGATFTLTDLDGTAISTAALTAYTSGGKAHHRGVTLSTTVNRILWTPKWMDESEEGMEKLLPEQLEKSTIFEDTTGEPRHYQHRKAYTTAGAESNMMLWFCAPDQVYRLRYWYEYRAPRLTEDTDVPLLPPRFHDLMISGAITRLAESNAQVENAVIWPGLYDMGLEQLKAYNREYWQRGVKHNPPYML